MNVSLVYNPNKNICSQIVIHVISLIRLKSNLLSAHRLMKIMFLRLSTDKSLANCNIFIYAMRKNKSEYSPVFVVVLAKNVSILNCYKIAYTFGWVKYISLNAFIIEN